MGTTIINNIEYTISDNPNLYIYNNSDSNSSNTTVHTGPLITLKNYGYDIKTFRKVIPPNDHVKHKLLNVEDINWMNATVTINIGTTNTIQHVITDATSLIEFVNDSYSSYDINDSEFVASTYFDSTLENINSINSTYIANLNSIFDTLASTYKYTESSNNSESTEPTEP